MTMLAAVQATERGAMARFEVITGPERRRRWSEDQKRAIVAESFTPGAVVSEVARRADISAGQIYRWRQELYGTAGFAQVLIGSCPWWWCRSAGWLQVAGWVWPVMSC